MQGCDCGTGNVWQYIMSVARQYQIQVIKYVLLSNTSNQANGRKRDYITKKGIFQYLWLNGELTPMHHDFLWNKYNILQKIENAVASNLSNGFVEGTNGKVKMIKRTMYSRCSPKLLAAKLMYYP